MRWLFSLWRIRRDMPAAREFRAILVKLAVWGCLWGPLCAVLFARLAGPDRLRAFLHSPGAVFWSMPVGIVFSACYYVAFWLGNIWLRTKLAGYPVRIARGVFVAYNALAGTWAFFMATAIVNHLPFGRGRIEVPHLWPIVAFEAISGAILALVIGAFIQLKLQVERTQAELREKEVAQRRLAEESARAQAVALQAQINPHFFFNTLNTISALIDVDAKAAQQTLGRLADLFRYTLSCSGSEATTIEREIAFVRDYLAIEQARFRHRLQVELPEDYAGGIVVPGLVLQPLVENAVKHGIAPRIDGGTVSIRIERTGGKAHISVRNTNDGDTNLSPGNLFRPGHALAIVRSRLRLFTGEEEPLKFRKSGEWTEVSFEVRATNS